MAKETVLKMLQVDLGQLNPPKEIEDYMGSCIDRAVQDLQGMNISVDVDNISDQFLIARYASWIYKARDKQEGRPWELQREINNRKVHRATGAGGCCR